MKNPMTKHSGLLLFAIFSITIAGCNKTEVIEIEREMEGPEYTHAVAILNATEGYEATGTVYFSKVDQGVRVTAEIAGLSEGNKGFHIHQYGDCTAANGTSAGGHFNPDEMDHAGPTDAMRHMGDMGNIVADSDGMATID
ncbi:MAG: superoxide dismutase family protein, partial [Bacteroidota bacterium]